MWLGTNDDVFCLTLLPVILYGKLLTPGLFILWHILTNKICISVSPYGKTTKVKSLDSECKQHCEFMVTTLCLAMKNPRSSEINRNLTSVKGPTNNITISLIQLLTLTWGHHHCTHFLMCVNYKNKIVMGKPFDSVSEREDILVNL